ncbi:MAG: outer membrane beta-barrel protein [Pseudomonadota bacterium]
MKNYLVASAAALLVSTSVSAQDMTGFYGGIAVGTGDVDTNVGVTGDGESFGAFVGYNYDFSGFVVGGELDIDNTDYALTGGAGSIDQTTRLKLRGGANLGGGLAYVTVGAVRAETSDLGDDSGRFFGIGYDYMITDNIMIGGEYLRHDFEGFDGSAIDVDVDTFKLRVGFKF